MGRTITVQDDETGVAARIVVEHPGGGPEQVITGLSLRASNGRGIRAEDLLLLEEMGLRLPERSAGHKPAPAPTPPPPVEESPSPRAEMVMVLDGEQPPVDTPPAEKTPPVPPPVVKKTTTARRGSPMATGKGRRRRNYRVSPPIAELDAAYRAVGGNLSALAARYGVPRHTPASWINTARRKGHVFALDGPGAPPVEGGTEPVVIAEDVDQ